MQQLLRLALLTLLPMAAAASVGVFYSTAQAAQPAGQTGAASLPATPKGPRLPCSGSLPASPPPCEPQAGGYTIAQPRYNLNPVNKNNIDSVVFQVAGHPRPSVAQIQLSSTWRPCVVTGSSTPWTISCVFSSAPETVRGTVVFGVSLAQ